MSVAKIDGQWVVIIDGKVVFKGTRRECKRYIPEEKPKAEPVAKKAAPKAKKKAPKAKPKTK